MAYYTEIYLEFVLSTRAWQKDIFEGLPVADSCVSKGEMIQVNKITPDHPGYPSPDTSWRISSQNQFFEPDINLHFLWLANRLEASQAHILEIKQQFELDPFFGVVFISPRLHCGAGLVINRTSLNLVAAFDARLVVDAWYDEPEEDG